VDVFLVARPQGKLLSRAAEVQEAINRRYKLYDSTLPPLHLTLARITAGDDANFTRAILCIERVASVTTPFSIAARGYLRFGLPHLAVGVAVLANTPLLSLREALATELKAQMVRLAGRQWRPHITLVSATFSNNSWGEAEWLAAYDYALEFPLEAECPISELELWYPEYVPKIKSLASFKLGQGRSEQATKGE